MSEVDRLKTALMQIRNFAGNVCFKDIPVGPALNHAPEYAWLLEHPDTSKGVQYVTMKPGGWWTADVNKALRFARKEDAQDFEDFFAPIEGEGSKPVEHQWD